tara:strand:- start:114 stop:452 length:339 start_codon:yes stop_codon:yes gene_type:complete
MKIYHNPRCRKSREALKIIESKNIQFEIIEYLKNPINKSELRQILKFLNIPAIELIRKNESIYKEKYKEKKFSNNEWLDIICDNPILMERPIILKDNQAIIGRPPEKVLNLL